MNWVDEGFDHTWNQPLARRVFSKDFPGDTSFRMVVNLTGIKQLGFSSPQQAVGKKLLVDWQGQTYRWKSLVLLTIFILKTCTPK